MSTSSEQAVLDVKNLRAYFNTPEGTARAVDDVSFSINKGEIFCLVGESGSGKSVTALSVIRLLPQPAGTIAGGHILLNGEDITHLPESSMRRRRGSDISMIFQEPMTSLNPVFTVGNQIMEVFMNHKDLSRDEARAQTLDMLRKVNIPDPEQRINEFPHQLSGGMKQRIMIAIALACQPKLLIADEPTTALDVTIQEQVLNLLKELKSVFDTSILLITHNLGIVNNYADRVGVMYAGRLVETGKTEDILNNPQHPYTRKLIEALPDRIHRDSMLNTIKGTVPPATQYGQGCRFYGRCPIGDESCQASQPKMEALSDTHEAACFKLDQSSRTEASEHTASNTRKDNTIGILLKAENVHVHYPIRKGILKKVVGYVRAVNGLNLEIQRGTTMALVGESGCGKTTFGKALVHLAPIREGFIDFDGKPIHDPKNLDKQALQRRVQMIFQDPYSSLNPRMRVGELIREGVDSLGLEWSAGRLKELLDIVSLPSNAVERYPHEFSGGQRQRISIARALAVNPEFIICDEATSALDVSVQAQILNLLRSIQSELGLTYLLITHDLSVVEYMADEVAVMYLGRIVERGRVDQVLDHTHHPYTKALLEAVPRARTKTADKKIILKGDVPSPANPPKGCHFHPRCPFAEARCKEAYPDATVIEDGHISRCVLD
jgi:oligopeptide/dipeptide ABC transporter ATP-binding protein